MANPLYSIFKIMKVWIHIPFSFMFFLAKQNKSRRASFIIKKTAFYYLKVQKIISDIFLLILDLEQTSHHSMISVVLHYVIKHNKARFFTIASQENCHFLTLASLNTSSYSNWSNNRCLQVPTNHTSLIESSDTRSTLIFNI